MISNIIGRRLNPTERGLSCSVRCLLAKGHRTLARAKDIGLIKGDRTVSNQKRYSIMARPFEQSYEVEVCQCDSNPEAIVTATRQKIIKVMGKPRPAYVAQYEHVYIRENID
jgi:hypothetical protein